MRDVNDTWFAWRPVRLSIWADWKGDEPGNFLWRTWKWAWWRPVQRLRGVYSAGMHYLETGDTKEGEG